MSNSSEDLREQANSFYAALARTATRGLALYFSRPVRLFRPSKVSGWQTLKGLASHHGQSLSPQYLSWLVSQQGFMVIPKHFIPPMLVNGVLGFVLWSTYTEVSGLLESRLPSHPTILAALSGACAGGTQALIAAPAENVRFALEGNPSVRGWSHAWKEVFRGTQTPDEMPRTSQVHEARQVRDWMREVGDMAGRGWEGWGWGCAKDVCGFAVFFSIFDFTRRIAIRTKAASQDLLHSSEFEGHRGHSLRRHTPRVVHATTLVFGGVIAGLAYELTCRPWDVARKEVHIHEVCWRSDHRSIARVLLQKVRDDGLLSYFRNPAPVAHDPSSLSPFRRRLYSAARTLARVGPWGMGFLVWEAFGPGIS